MFQSDDQIDSLSNNSSRRESTVSTSNSNSQNNLDGSTEDLPPGWSIQKAPNGKHISTCICQTLKSTTSKPTNSLLFYLETSYYSVLPRGTIVQSWRCHLTFFMSFSQSHRFLLEPMRHPVNV